MKTIENKLTLPESALNRLYDCTGTQSDDTKGFLLFYINSFGQPAVTSKSSTMTVEMALSKIVEVFVNSQGSDNPLK
jgi:hypothetical protein